MQNQPFVETSKVEKMSESDMFIQNSIAKGETIIKIKKPKKSVKIEEPSSASFNKSSNEKEKYVETAFNNSNYYNDKPQPNKINEYELAKERDIMTPEEAFKKIIIDEKEMEKLKREIESSKSNEGREVLEHLGEYIEDPFVLIESYFQGQHLERLVRHQIESYNHFIGYQIQRTIQMFNPVIIHSENDYVAQYEKYLVEISISFENFKLYPPQIHENNGATKVMLPQEAKLRNFTYSSTMTIDIQIQYIIRNTETMDTPKIITKLLPKINIGKMPIMLKSSICVLSQNKYINPIITGECPMDCGGYFIIKGSEKTVLGQERAAENKIYCFDGKNTTKWSWFAEIKSIPDFKCISPKQIEMMIASKNNGFGNGIFVAIPRIKHPIELFVLFRALGVSSDKEICEYIVLNIEDEKLDEVVQFLQASIIDSNKYLKKEDALRHITSAVAYTPINMDKETGAKKKHEFTIEVLNNDLFPHCKTLPQKLYLLGYMARKLIMTSLGWLPPDDRDSYLNKRVELTGTLLNNLFRNYFNKLVKEMQKQIVREINNGSWRSTDDYENIVNMTNIYKIMKSTTIENGINRALATGDFSIKQANSNKVGVAQVLNRLTYAGSLSHLRRINTPLEKSGELVAPRKLHNTTWGFLCLAGDAEVLMSNRMDIKKIRDIEDGNWVNTVNRKTLEDVSSEMYRSFCKMPDKLYEVTTISGRKIKATAEHPFLVGIHDEKYRMRYEMKRVEELKPTDHVVIRHTVKHIPDENTTRVSINESDVLEHYRKDLSERGLLNAEIPVFKLKIVARLLGVLNTPCGILQFVKNEDSVSKTHYMLKSNFISHIEDISNMREIVKDIQKLGFNIKNDEPHNWYFDFVVNSGSFSYFMHLMGACVNTYTPSIPDWLMTAELSIKREFVSSFQSYYGSEISYSGVLLKKTVLRKTNDKIKPFIGSIITILSELGIVSTLYEDKIYVGIEFDNDLDNIIRYADTIRFTYNDAKRNNNVDKIEFLKTYRYRGEIKYEEYTQLIDHQPNKGCLCVPISSIVEVEPEMVYDFTTRSENHSFVASSFVVSNCPVETPEGQSIGVVKNISYMTHLTISTNSGSLYEYIMPNVVSVDSVRPIDLHGKVKVFINGSWVGVSNKPQELYNDIKDKKHRGIINIYTSIVFDYKLMEIRVCSDGGRLVRPVLRVRNNKALITRDIIDRIRTRDIGWNDLLTCCNIDEAVIEYIDPDEQNVSMVAMKTKHGYLHGANEKINYTHCEIHPSTIFGVLASCIPFPDYNQSPRNTYQCLHPDETVKMANGTKKAIRDVKVGDAVLTFHPETFEVSSTKVVNQFVRSNEYPIYKVKTAGGKTIRATEDHRFMTDRGWKTVKEMMHDSSIRIGVMAADSLGRVDECAPEKNGCLFAPIVSITREPNGLVSCIETESENHSFFTTHNIMSANCAMSKQSLGVYALNYDQRMDKTAYVLTYPSKPLVDTRIMNILNLNKIPSGCQIHVAIMSHTGYNQEDSVLVNKGSIDRGLFMSTIYHTEKDEDKNIIRDEIIRCKPDPAKTKGIKFGNYNKLNAQGFIPENTLVDNRDIIIAKIVPIKENRNDPTKTIKYEDQSKTFRTTEETYIDKNYTGRNGDGYNFAKVRVRILRKPVLGDKFSSRMGQKGTCGLIIPECDMPFTKDGLRPDIIINPHAIPSRMTIGQLKETILGKVLLELGMFGDGTSFGTLDVKTIISNLQKLGYESYGNEVLYNGLTGEQLETSIFIGPVFYQRLKHMVNDKQHSRSIGPMVNLTRQPAEGRSRDGGFRIGEMERDVMCAHGMTQFCRERLYTSSDRYSMYVCNKCGLNAAYNSGTVKRMNAKNDMTVHLCNTCGNMTNFSKVEVPYAFKLLSQELQTINVSMRMITDE
jgi:DNA-directed RNA polymerase beta subunit/intein/homing endonuclease